MAHFSSKKRVILLGFLTSQIGIADFALQASNVSPLSERVQNPNTTDVDQFSPSMSGENTFIEESQERMNRLHQQNRNMMEDDREMMQEGYDPNEISPQYNPSSNSHRQQPHWKPPNGQ